MPMLPSRHFFHDRRMHDESGQTPTTRLLAQARALAQGGELDAAERLCRQALAAAPGSVETLRLLAKLALARRRAGEAVDWLERAARLGRDDRDVLKDLGAAYRAAGALDSARYVLERVLELDPRDSTARLLLGDVYELDGRPEPALAHYFLALREAAAQGTWLSDAVVPAPLRALVAHAREVVAKHRAEATAQALAAARDRFGTAALRRIDAALAQHLAAPPLAGVDLAELTAGFVDAADFSGLAAAAAAIRAELDAFLADPPPTPRFAPFSLRPASPEDPTPAVCRIALAERGRGSRRIAERFPRTWAALAAAGLPDVPGVGPEAQIVVLAPDERLALPPRGNVFAEIVLALGDGLAVEVGDQRRAPGVGELAALSLGGGATLVNAGNVAAAALLAEAWHLALDAGERKALADLLTTDVHFLASVDALG